ncbi:MAG: hypothetical protein V7K83_02060 [Nostoc sp.]
MTNTSLRDAARSLLPRSGTARLSDHANGFSTRRCSRSLSTSAQ